MEKTTGALILAAGKGTRLKSTDINKVVTPLAGRPMVQWTVERLRQASIEDIVVVVGFARESVEQALGDSVRYVEQHEQLGTGHAAAVGEPVFSESTRDILVVYGDHSAFYTPEFYQNLLQQHRLEENGVTMVVLEHDNPSELAWGRVIRGADNSVVAIVEEKECTPEQKAIRELNAGCYVFSRELLRASLPTLRQQSGGEYYLTDVIAFAVAHGWRVGAVTASDTEVGIGVNTPEQREAAQALFTKLHSA